MDKRILLGIDANYSGTTQYALQTVIDLFERATPSFAVLLLHIIPHIHITTEYPHHFIDQYELTAPTAEQKKQAEEVLTQASAVLQQQGFDHQQIELLTRVGSPADEIVKVARERHVSAIVIGSRGDNWHQRLRRMILGSISQQILQLAPCPVIVVPPPRLLTSQNLVAWYEQAARSYLTAHTSSLIVLTPETVIKLFPFPSKQFEGQKELEAAALALENLAGQGHLFRRDIQGQTRYIND
jgi:nucleotide-binding universal stress UspA family protein